ncbi:hypothetical protein [Rhizobium leguminosarum]|jgi:hypothetical protein|uniref:hypothetical protein n=1 Tax=Rhizobium leguminosarum TaxID=384 RepID=UPI001FF06DEA|nr:hypothetical protein [Rhizobium leguminosarum]
MAAAYHLSGIWRAIRRYNRQHSRDTFAPSKLGDRMATFDAELSELLRAYSNDDRLSFVVRTRIVWGEIKLI